jgi:transcription elongation factor GreB
VSKAFTKEDDDELPERVGRVRSSSGLPPGAVNYMTVDGARRLQHELEGADGGRVAELRRMLDSATLVSAPETLPGEVLFGATVTVRGGDGKEACYRIVGVDETRLAPEWVSWMSPVAKVLIGTQIGDRVHLPNTSSGEEVEIVKIEY